MKNFIKQGKVIKLLTVVVSLLMFVLANVLIFNFAMDKPINLSYAATVLKFSQEILPYNPVKSIELVKKTDSKTKDLSRAEYRFITQLKESNVSKEPAKLVAGPIVTFNGTSLYPNSEIFLEIHSNAFFTSTMSDSQGNWSWTNYGHPLDPGEHTLKMYNFSPYEISGKRDIFAQKYSFAVDQDKTETTNLNGLYLNNSNHEEIGNGELLGREEKQNLSRLYVFDVVLLNKKEYNASEDIDIQLLFSSLKQGAQNQADIKYELYNYKDGDEKNAKLAAEFEDRARIDESGSFLKRISLNDEVIDGSYILKIVAYIGSEEYVQSVKFKIDSRPVVQIGNMTVTKEKFGSLIVWNIVFVLVFMIIITSLILIEMKRFFVYGSIDEQVLKKKGYFSK